MIDFWNKHNGKIILGLFLMLYFYLITKSGFNTNSEPKELDNTFYILLSIVTAVLARLIVIDFVKITKEQAKVERLILKLIVLCVVLIGLWSSTNKFLVVVSMAGILNFVFIVMSIINRLIKKP